MTPETVRMFESWLSKRWELSDRNLHIASLGLPGEVGEILEHIKKDFRDHKPPDPMTLKLEFGDALHYLIVLMHFYGMTVEEVIMANIAKLSSRDIRKRLCLPRATDAEERAIVSSGSDPLLQPA